MAEDWDGYPDDAPEVVAVGGDLEPTTLAHAYRAGVFPWPSHNFLSSQLLRARYASHLRAARIRYRGAPGWALPWFAPLSRAVLRPGGISVSRSMRATLRRSGWTTSVDTAFAEVVAGCADRPKAWITPAMRRAYVRLHWAGGAHSIEVWSEEGQLIGGLYGVAVGAVFSGESMFHRRPDASKAALLDLADRLARGGGVVIDSQTPTEHLLRLGQQIVSRQDFRHLLARERDHPVVMDRTRLPVARLVDRAEGPSGRGGSSAGWG